LRRALTTTLLVLVACTACDRGEPDASFRELTTPFLHLTADCWPFKGSAPFTTPWFAGTVVVRASETTLTADVFEATDAEAARLGALPGTVVSPPAGDGPLHVTITAPGDRAALTGCMP